jgi:hypothetical protein
MKENEIDTLAKNFLIAKKTTFSKYDGIDNKKTIDEIKDRILTVNFDCTPNWGIEGVTDVDRTPKMNWYLRDPEIAAIAQERYNNLDTRLLRKILVRATNDLAGNEVNMIGFGIYGSYIYRKNGLTPEDLDVFVITDSDIDVEMDALRYRASDLTQIFKDQSLAKISSNELGLSIISSNFFNKKTRSYMVTDCALLDISTTISHESQVKAKPLPPYIIIQNAIKMVNWGVSAILYKPQTLTSRLDEAIRMRNMLTETKPELFLDKLPKLNRLPTDPKKLIKMTDSELIERAKEFSAILIKDKKQIREQTIKNLENCGW